MWSDWDDPARCPFATLFKACSNRPRVSSKQPSEWHGSRQVVKAYAEYIRYVEQLYETAEGSARGPEHESEPPDTHSDK